MEVTRYIPTLAIKIKDDNQLIHNRDENIQYENDDDFGELVRIEGRYDKVYSLVECIYDLETKKLNIGIELDYYPVVSDLEFTKDEEVYYEKSHRLLSEAKIVDIVFEKFDLEIVKGENMDSWYKNNYKDIDDSKIYSIKKWKPFYVLDCGVKIEWIHQLYHKF